MKKILALMVVLAVAVSFSGIALADCGCGCKNCSGNKCSASCGSCNIHKVPEAKRTGGNLFADLAKWESNVKGQTKTDRSKGDGKCGLTPKNCKAK